MKKRQQVFDLWMECFQDTEEFVRFYFDRKYQDENALIHEEAGKALAGLQMIPYPMTWAGTTIATSYISGACTLPSARNRGIMTRLLSEAFQIMYHQGIAASCLVPAESWLFDYYRKTGYAAIFSYSQEVMEASSLTPQPGVLILEATDYDQQLLSECHSYFDRKMRERDCCIQHPFDDFVAILDDLHAGGGQMWIARPENSQKISGLALALPDESNVEIKEILCNDNDIRETLLQKISESGKYNTVTCKQPPHPGNRIRWGMARIVNAREMLSLYARQHPAVSCRLLLEDAQLEENNGLYVLSDGHCYHTRHLATTTDPVMDIPTLTETLFGQNPGIVFPSASPYMSLMLD